MAGGAGNGRIATGSTGRQTAQLAGRDRERGTLARTGYRIQSVIWHRTPAKQDIDTTITVMGITAIATALWTPR
jgi:hypothetical protein